MRGLLRTIYESQRSRCLKAISLPTRILAAVNASKNVARIKLNRLVTYHGQIPEIQHNINVFK